MVKMPLKRAHLSGSYWSALDDLSRVRDSAFFQRQAPLLGD